MEAREVVRLFVNKAIVPTEPKRHGNPGYGQVKALRVQVCARLKGLDNDTRLVAHLKKHPPPLLTHPSFLWKTATLLCIPNEDNKQGSFSLRRCSSKFSLHSRHVPHCSSRLHRSQLLRRYSQLLSAFFVEFQPFASAIT
jgi:hypothetical protein